MSQSAIPARAAVHAGGAAASPNTAGPGGMATDEFLALLAQVIAPAIPATGLPADAAAAGATAAADDATPADAASDAALACVTVAVPLVIPTLPPLPATPSSDLPGGTPPRSDVADAVLQALAPLAGQALGKAAAPVAGPILPAGPDSLFKVDEDGASADGAGTAALAAAAPRLEATGNGREVAVVRKIDLPVGHGRWSESVGHEVRLLVERGVQSATLKLTPEHLGPVEVRIDLAGDKTNVWFGAAHADTRAALADAIPKLREMFAGAGLMLGDTGVRQDTPGRFGASSPQGGFGESTDGEAAAGVTSTTAVAVKLGLVDAYA